MQQTTMQQTTVQQTTVQQTRAHAYSLSGPPAMSWPPL
jgi:hypothetical protein